MKNANSRFVRVLAVALVVLMVLPAALVGCGSNKANDAAISEALAAAQAAKDAADKAQQKAEAAQKELEEANKKAEQLEAELEALKTTKAPDATTAPVSVDKQQVLAYAQEALAEIGADLAAYVAEAEIDLADYYKDDVDAMKLFHAMTVNAIYKAATIDDIVEAVEALAAYVEAMPTYADRVYEAYKAIDFASDVDVVDVVYAKAILDSAVAASIDVTAYGEDELDLAKLISEEYARYTGVGTLAEGVEEALYAEIYSAAEGILAEVVALLNDKLEVSALQYKETVKEDVEEVKALFEEWFEDYFKGEEIEANYEAFRQAFIGEAVITTLNKTEDAVWAAVLGMEERAAALEAALIAYEDGFQDELEEIAELTLADINLENGNMNNHADLLATVKAQFAAWIAENDLADKDGKPGDVVKSIIGEDVLTKYNDYALLIDYLVALNATTASIDVAGVLAAYDQYDSKELAGRFDFAKYGAALKSVADWEKAFAAAEPGSKGFEAFEKVTATIAEVKAAGVYEDIIENAFDLDLDEYNEVYGLLSPVYTALAAKKVEADKINKTIAKILKAGINKDNGAEFVGIAGNKISAYFDQADKNKDAALVAGLIKTNFFDDATIKFLDVNYNSMINWADLEALWDSFDAMKADVEGAAVEIMNTYFAIKSDVVDGKLEFTFGGNDYYLAKDAEKLAITIFAYDLIKKIEEDGKKIDVTADVLQIDEDLTFNYKAYGADGKEVIVAIDYATAFAYAKNMVAEYHALMDKLDDDLYYNVDRKLPFMYSYSAIWNGGAEKDGVKENNEKRIAAIFANTNHKFNGEQINAIANEDVQKALKDAVAAFFADTTSAGNYKSDYNKASDETLEKNNKEISGYRDAVLAVNPASYFTVTFKKVDGVATSEVLATSFDKAAYKKALDAKIKENLGKFTTQIFNLADAASYEVVDAVLQGTITVIVKAAFEHDLWNLAGAFDAYTYEIDVKASDLANATITVLNAKKKAVAAVKVGKFVETDVYAEFAVQNTGNGVYEVVASLCDKNGDALANEADVLAEILTKYEDLDECLADRIGFEADAHVYDVRKAAEEIGANFDKVGKVPAVNQSYDFYGFLSAAQIQKIFDSEKTADYNYATKTLKAEIYGKDSYGNIIFGSYVNSLGEFSGAEDFTLQLITEDYAKKVDAATDLKAAKAILAAFKAEVDTYLDGKDGYQK